MNHISFLSQRWSPKHTIDISSGMLSFVRASSTKYDIYLHDKKKEERQCAVRDLTSEETDLQSKKEFILKTCTLETLLNV